MVVFIDKMSSGKAKPGKRKAVPSKAPAATKKPRKPRGMVELPEGIVLTDLTKKKWRLGRLIGWGGFGALYLASPDNGSPVDENAEHVIKVVRTRPWPVQVTVFILETNTRVLSDIII